MSEEKEINEAPVSEETVDTGASEQQEVEQTARQVPLEALEAERRKRQEIEAQNRILQDYAMRYQELQAQAKAQPQEDDGEDLVNKRELKQSLEKLTKQELAELKREIAEETFKEVNPEAIRQINTHLKEILERKPWLAQSIQDAPNRYSRAYEIVQDYAPVVAAKKAVVNDAQRIVENSKKPGSPTAIGKAAQLNNSDYLRSIGGTKEFREYRQKLLQGK